MALIDVIDCCSILETELTHGKINVLKIIEAIDECIAGLNEARKLLEGFRKKRVRLPQPP
jgi:ribosomal protein L7/L12